MDTKIKALVFLAVLMILVPGAGLDLEAQAGKDKDDFPPGMYTVIPELTFLDVSVSSVLRDLADLANINIVFSSKVGGSCNLSLENVTVKDTFDIILLSNKLAYTKTGDIYYIITSAEYMESYGVKYGDTRIVKTFRLDYAAPDRAFEFLNSLKSEIGSLLVEQDSGTVMVVDTPERIEKMEEALAALEKGGEVVVLNLNYANAADIEAQLKKELDDKNAGSIVADEKTNSVIIRTYPGRMKSVKDIIAALDKKTRQVLIDVKIISINLTDDFEAEVKWEGMFTKLSGIDFLGSHPFEPVARLGTHYLDDFGEREFLTDKIRSGAKSILGQEIHFGKIGSKGTFESVLRVLRTLGDVKILSNPKITVVEGKEAKILIGERIPLLTSTTMGGTGGSAGLTSETVEFIDVGIQLFVTIEGINDMGYVTMQIKPVVSSLLDIITTDKGSVVPVVKTAEAETVIMVKDNTTIMIGGLREDKEDTKIRKVPFLSSIPILGLLFRSHVSKSGRSEILVMITPHIIGGDMLETGELILPEEGLKPYMEYESEGMEGDVIGGLSMKTGEDLNLGIEMFDRERSERR